MELWFRNITLLGPLKGYSNITTWKNVDTITQVYKAKWHYIYIIIVYRIWILGMWGTLKNECNKICLFVHSQIFTTYFYVPDIMLFCYWAFFFLIYSSYWYNFGTWLNTFFLQDCLNYQMTIILHTPLILYFVYCDNLRDTEIFNFLGLSFL